MSLHGKALCIALTFYQNLPFASIYIYRETDLAAPGHFRPVDPQRELPGSGDLHDTGLTLFHMAVGQSIG